MSPAAAMLYAEGRFTRAQLYELARYAQTRVSRAEHRLERLSPNDPRYGPAQARMEERLATLTAYMRAYMAMPREGG